MTTVNPFSTVINPFGTTPIAAAPIMLHPFPEPAPVTPKEKKPKNRRPLKDATEDTIKKLIANDSKVLEKASRSTNGKTEVFQKLEHEKLQTMSDFIVMPKVQIPIRIDTEDLKVNLIATLFCHSSYNNLRAIYFNSISIAPETERYRYAIRPGILGIPNHDEKGFTITIKEASEDPDRYSYRGNINTGFGKFDYTPTGAEEYLRSYLYSRALETRNTNVRRRLGFEAAAWALPASAKMLLKIFFKKYGPAETVITEEMLGKV